MNLEPIDLRLVFLHTISKIVQTLHTVVLHIQVIVIPPDMGGMVKCPPMSCVV